MEGEDYDLWESGVNRAKGIALLVHTGSQISAELEAVTEQLFVLTVRYREKDLIRVGVVYATANKPGREVLDVLCDVVQRYPGPLVLLGDFNKEALRRPTYQDRLRTWGYTAYPNGWMWTWRGAGAHAHDRSMIGFILAPSDMHVAQVQVLGRIPVQTDNRMVLAEVQSKAHTGWPRWGPSRGRPRRDTSTSQRSNGNSFAKSATGGHIGTSQTRCYRSRHSRRRPWRY